MSFFLQLLINGLVTGSIYAMVALGFVLIYKATGILNFAQGELVLVGAYVCWCLVVQFHLPFLAAFVLTLIFAILLGLLLERCFLRPMIGEPIISVIMLTIGLADLLRAIVQAIWSTDTRVFPQVFPSAPVHLGNFAISQVYLWSSICALFFLIIFTLFFKFSKTGIAMRAVADDQLAAQSLGISIKKVFAMAWCISAVVSAIGGVLLGNINGINSSLSFIGLKVFPCVILGGLDSVPGAIIGGLTVGVLESLSGGYLDQYVGGGIKDVFPFVILIIILMVKPYGLFGTEEVERI